jgi:hypothetical protein
VGQVRFCGFRALDEVRATTLGGAPRPLFEGAPLGRSSRGRPSAAPRGGAPRPLLEGTPRSATSPGRPADAEALCPRGNRRAVEDMATERCGPSWRGVSRCQLERGRWKGRLGDRIGNYVNTERTARMYSNRDKMRMRRRRGFGTWANGARNERGRLSSRSTE